MGLQNRVCLCLFIRDPQGLNLAKGLKHAILSASQSLAKKLHE